MESTQPTPQPDLRMLSTGHATGPGQPAYHPGEQPNGEPLPKQRARQTRSGRPETESVGQRLRRGLSGSPTSPAQSRVTLAAGRGK